MKALEESVVKIYEEIGQCDKDFASRADRQDYNAHLAHLKLINDSMGGLGQVPVHTEAPPTPEVPTDNNNATATEADVEVSC